MKSKRVRFQKNDPQGFHKRLGDNGDVVREVVLIIADFYSEFILIYLH